MIVIHCIIFHTNMPKILFKLQKKTTKIYDNSLNCKKMDLNVFVFYPQIVFFVIDLVQIE